MIVQKNQIPTYNEALAALENGDDGIVKNAVFAVEYYDGQYVGRVIEAVRALLQRPKLTPKQITSVGRALHGLERMPLRTPGLDVHLALVIQNDDGAASYDLHLSDERFRTESGGYVKFDYGSDSFSGPTFDVGPDYRDEGGWHFGVQEWPDAFSESIHEKLEIEDNSNDSLLDWEHPDGSEFWQWIADHD